MPRICPYLCGVALASCLMLADQALATEPTTVETTSLSDHGASVAIEAATSKAREVGAKVSIAVVDVNGKLLAFQRLGNAFIATIDNAIGKASTAAQLGKPSKAMQDTIDEGKVSYLAIDGLTPLEGGIPIIIGDKVVGGIASSGAVSDIDAQIASAGAEAVAYSEK